MDAEVEASTSDADVGLRSVNPTYESGENVEDVGWVRRDSTVTQQNGASDLHQRIEEDKRRRKKKEVGDIPPVGHQQIPVKPAFSRSVRSAAPAG